MYMYIYMYVYIYIYIYVYIYIYIYTGDAIVLGRALGLFVCGGQKLFAKINPDLGNYLQIAVLLCAFGSMSKCIKKPFLA